MNPQAAIAILNGLKISLQAGIAVEYTTTLEIALTEAIKALEGVKEQTE